MLFKDHLPSSVNPFMWQRPELALFFSKGLLYNCEVKGQPPLRELGGYAYPGQAIDASSLTYT